MPQLFLFGDSITWGAWDPERGGWAQRLRAVIDRYQVTHPDFWCPVYNLGIPGDTSAGVVKRLVEETATRREPNEEAIFLIAIGINDSRIGRHNSATDVSECVYTENLRQILTHAESISTKKIGFLGLTPVDDTLVDPLPWDPGKAYRLERVKSFNSACQDFCERSKTHFLPIFDTWMERDYRALLCDGLHPNAEGHELIFHEVRKFLKDSELLPEPF